MTSKRESALQGLVAALCLVPESTVLRDAVAPERIPAGGLLILRDGEAGDPELSFSPTTYHYEHAAEVEVFAQRAKAADRDAAFDTLLQAVAGALASDRTLGGAVEHLTWSSPRTEDLAVPAGAGIKAGVVTITLHYATTDPLS